MPPFSQTVAGRSRRCTDPSARVTASRTGIGARPRSTTVMAVESASGTTAARARSSGQASKNQVVQNHDRFRSATFEIVLKTSYGWGCLLIQRRP